MWVKSSEECMHSIHICNCMCCVYLCICGKASIPITAPFFIVTQNFVPPIFHLSNHIGHARLTTILFIHSMFGRCFLALADEYVLAQTRLWGSIWKAAIIYISAVVVGELSLDTDGYRSTGLGGIGNKSEFHKIRGIQIWYGNGCRNWYLLVIHKYKRKPDFFCLY